MTGETEKPSAPTLLERFYEHWTTPLALGATGCALAALAAHQLVRNRLDVREWDYMLVSGCVTTLASLWFARVLPERFDTMLTRLRDRGTLKRHQRELTAASLTQIRLELQRLSQRWSLRTGLVFAVAVTITWIVIVIVRDDQPPFDKVAGPVVGAIGGFLVGIPVGRMIAYGQLTQGLRQHEATLDATRGHPDGAAGLKPLGDFYLFQALLLAFPAAYLLAWSLLMIDSGLNDRYDGFREAYLGFLALAIVLELAAFVLPLWAVHRIMAARKDHELAEADRQQGPRIASLRKELDGDLTSARRSELRDLLEHLNAEYREAETMPTWPLDQTLRRRVTVGNLVLVVPLISQAIKLAD